MKRKWIIGVLFLAGTASAAGIVGINSSGVNLGHFSEIKCSTGMTCTNDTGKFKIASSPTIATSVTITGADTVNAALTLQADNSDDNGDDWKLSSVASGNAFTIANDTSGSQVTKLSISTAGVLTFSDSETLTNASDVLTFAADDNDLSMKLAAFEAKDAILTLQADESDDSGDDWQFKAAASGNALTISNDTSGSQVAKMTISTSGAVLLTSTLAGYLWPQVAATATTITAAQCGSTFSNSGAVQMELPEASTVIGCTLTFATLNASNFDINPDDNDKIVTITDANGDAMRNATVGNTITIRAVSASQWVVTGVNGTWTDIN